VRTGRVDVEYPQRRPNNELGRTARAVGIGRPEEQPDCSQGQRGIAPGTAVRCVENGESGVVELLSALSFSWLSWRLPSVIQ